MKKIVSMLLVVSLCLMYVSAFAVKDWGKYGRVEWSFEDGVLSFSGSGETSSSGPWKKYISKVKTLEYYGSGLTIDLSVTDYKRLTTIKLGNGVQIIPRFMDNSKKKINLIIDSDCIDMHGFSFMNIDIASIELGSNVTDYIIENKSTIYNKDKTVLCAYFGKDKGTFIVPDSVEKIAKFAFCKCGLKEIILPQGLTTIGEYAFSDCRNLKRLTIPGNVKEIGIGILKNMFYQCKLEELLYVNLQGIKQIGEPEWDDTYSNVSVKTLIIPKYTNGVRAYISDSKSLNYIIISEGISSIKNEIYPALYNNKCKNLIGVYLPSSLNSITSNNIPFIQDVRLFVIEGSQAHKFAVKNGYPYTIVTPIEKITLSEEEASLQLKKTMTLKETIFPENSTSKSVQWISTNELVATVEKGKVKAVGEGECNILCRGLDCGLVTAVCHIAVTK